MAKQKRLEPLSEYELKQLQKISDQEEVKVSHEVNNAINAYMQLSPNISKTLLEVSQQMHGNLLKLDYYVYMAGFEKKGDPKEKSDYLEKALIHLLYCYRSLTYLVRVKALSVGAANNVIVPLNKAKSQIEKWNLYLIKEINKGGN